MQTRLAAFIKDTEQGREADRILRACVHCGFCTATCPTYQLLGDELDGPRGRIYLIKQMLEGEAVSRKTQVHLDRCLTCLNCMTTCPSGVDYSKLVDIGRELIERRVERPLGERLMRYMLRKIVPHPERFSALLRLGQAVRPLVPALLKDKIPARQHVARNSLGGHARKVLILDGCVQSALTPRTNIAAARVLDRLGISVISAQGSGCCGAVSQHLAAPDEAKTFMRRNIDAWWPHIEAGAEAIVITASGCGALVKDYHYHLRNDPAYRDKAQRICALAKDLSEVLVSEDLASLNPAHGLKIAFHSPCTLQHAQKLFGVVERILQQAEFELLAVSDAHSCCGSAGTYSVLQADLSMQLLEKKLSALQAHGPELIATANVGCQTHLESKSRVPVVHWIELFADRRTK